MKFESVSQLNFKNRNRVERHFIRTTVIHPCGAACAHYSVVCFSVVALTLLPTGGGGFFGPRHQTGSKNSRTLSPRVSKISGFSFMLFGHILTKFQVN